MPAKVTGAATDAARLVWPSSLANAVLNKALSLPLPLFSQTFIPPPAALNEWGNERSVEFGGRQRQPRHATGVPVRKGRGGCVGGGVQANRFSRLLLMSRLRRGWNERFIAFFPRVDCGSY